MTQEDYAAVALSRVPNVGTQLYRSLVDHFGSAQAALKASPNELRSVRGIQRKTAQHFAAKLHYEEADAVAQFAKRHPLHILHPGSSTYPGQLRDHPDSPVVLYQYGRVDWTNPYPLALIGSRRMNAAGRAQIERLLDPLVPLNVLVISGLAYGVDIAAHRRALHLGLPTVGVLGGGFEQVYPHAHRADALRMAEQEGGGVLSEYPPWKRPDRTHFPARNRIVALLAAMTVVVQSGTTGGSLITANMAHRYRRPVGACPGVPGDPFTAGCNALIKSGKARLIEEGSDITTQLGWAGGVQAVQTTLTFPDDLSPLASQLLELLQQEQRELDTLMRLTARSSAALAGELLELELRGLVSALPGRQYRLRHSSTGA